MKESVEINDNVPNSNSHVNLRSMFIFPHQHNADKPRFCIKADIKEFKVAAEIGASAIKIQQPTCSVFNWAADYIGKKIAVEGFSRVLNSLCELLQSFVGKYKSHFLT